HGLVLAKDAVVDEDRRQLIADCLGHEQRGDGRVDAAADRGDRLLLTDRLADLENLSLAIVAEVPGWFEAGDVEEEVAENLRARFGMRNFRVEEDAVACAVAILESGDRRIRGLRDYPKTGRRLDDPVAVAGPHPLMRRRIREQGRL